MANLHTGTQDCMEPYLHPNISQLILARKWIVEFGGEKEAHRVAPRGHIELNNRSQVNPFRPLFLTLSAVPKARLSVELRIANIIYPFGMCDAWERSSTQLPTTFRAPIIGAPAIDQSHNLRVVIFNRYHRFSTIVDVQIEGVYSDGQR